MRNVSNSNREWLDTGTTTASRRLLRIYMTSLRQERISSYPIVQSNPIQAQLHQALIRKLAMIL
nr:hypothetical protein [Salipaludibacillus neizhouensis]